MVIISSKINSSSCVISWRSRKLKRVVSSSTDAEALAANEVLDEIVYIKEVLKEMFGDQATSIPLEIYTDLNNL